MAEQPKSRLPIKRFLGLVTNEDSHDLAPGQMQIQNNVQIFSPGKAVVRGGMRPVQWDNTVDSTPANIISQSYFRRPESDFVVYEDANGNIKAGRNPH